MLLYYYYAAFNVLCVGHNDGQSQVIARYSNVKLVICLVIV